MQSDTKPASGEPVTVRVSDVQPERVEWLWPERIAIGKVSMIAGDPGLGKSMATLDLASRVTTGAGWPDCPSIENPVGGVVLAGRIVGSHIINRLHEPQRKII